MLESQIHAGKLRGVDEMQFCYLPFLQKDEQGSHWILQPVWQVLCGYTEDPSNEQVMPYYAKSDTDGSLTVPEEYNDYFYNAQTGEMVQVYPLTRDRDPQPAYEILTWEDIQQKQPHHKGSVATCGRAFAFHCLFSSSRLVRVVLGYADFCRKLFG